MNNCKYIILLTAILVSLLTACSNTKHLGPGQNLYMGADIKIESSVPISKSKKKELKSELEALARPKPNSKILGIRFKLTVYNMVDTPKKDKGLKHWLKYKVGEPPVIAQMSQLQKNAEIFQNRLENRGYFHDTVTLDTVVKNKKLTAKYVAHIATQYKIKTVTFPQGADTLSAVIRQVTKNSILKPNRPFDLDVIKNERTRIDNGLKQRGFFYFNPDYLLINADTTVGDHKVDMKMIIKPQTPLDASVPYRINDVVVFADYRINSRDTSVKMQNAVITSDKYKIIDSAKKFNPKLFSRLLVFKKGYTYNRTRHNQSLNRLVTLGVFRFVNARFEKADTVKKGDYLNVTYYLTPMPKKSIRFTATGLTKSNNSNGGQVSVNWLNRNLFKGAEQLTISPYVGLEKQISSSRNASTRRLGIDAALTVPKIISPFNIKISSAYVPKTRFQVGYELFSSDTLYTLNSFSASYGYIWKQKLENENTLNLLNINYVRPTKITDAFQKEIDTIITLYRSIEPQLIIGSSYNYNLNTQARANNRKNNFYFNGNVDLSGNTIGLLSGANVKSGKQKEIFGVPFSQYIRLEADFRHYYSLSKYTVLASRFWAGAGITYGNSQFMPYARAFFAGGTNDIRAFRSRSLGPGSFVPKNNGIFIPDQPGDMKLEASVELRAKLFSVVRGAVFIDAGNIWTLRADSARPGAQFTGNFLNQVAVGAGYGLRFDLTILVLRFDIAYPIRKPYANNLSSNKPVYNLAIGYPF